jgi:opacity protein-like surface antigen
MRRFCLVLIATLMGVSAAFAQSASDYHRWEIAGSFVYAKQEANSGEQFTTEGTDQFNFQPCTPEGVDALGANLQKIFCLRRGFKGGSGSNRLFTSWADLRGRRQKMCRPLPGRSTSR